MRFRDLFLVILPAMTALASGCGPEPGGGDGGDGGTFDSGPYAFVVTTDYTTGSFATIDITGRNATSEYCNAQLCSIHSDAIARSYHGDIYVVNRLGQDNIQVLVPELNFATLVQYSVGAGSNPQDIAFANGKAYISRQELNNVLVADPLTGKKIKEIDLSQFSDADGNCEPSQMVSDGQFVYVAILRLDRNNKYVPSGQSFVAVIDSTTDSLVGNGIPLNTVNPYAGFFLDGTNLYVGCSGNFGITDGAIELIDTTSLSDKGIVVSEQTLGGDINFFTLYAGKIYTVLSDANFNTSVVSYDLNTHTLNTTVTSSGFNLAGIAINSLGELYVSDRSPTNPGVRIFSTGTGGHEFTPHPIDTGLPPIQILFVE